MRQLASLGPWMLALVAPVTLSIAPGCKSVVDVVRYEAGSGGEGAGGQTQTTSVTQTTTAGSPTGSPTGSWTMTTTGTGAGTPTGTSAGMPTTCDEGDCVDCINSDCTMQVCGEPIYACFDNPDCAALNDCWNTCYDECGGVPDPANCHQTCVWGCNEQTPSAVEDMTAMYSCLVCVACPLDCSAEGSGYCGP